MKVFAKQPPDLMVSNSIFDRQNFRLPKKFYKTPVRLLKSLPFPKKGMGVYLRLQHVIKRPIHQDP